MIRMSFHRSLLTLLLCFKLSIATAPYGTWSPDSYPDSLVDLDWCSVNRPSFLCDPNDLLKNESDVDEIDQELNRFRSVTVCGCSEEYNSFCQVIAPHGYTASIALMHEMLLNRTQYSSEDKHEAGSVFADRLRQRLSSRAQCDDDLLIVYSRVDRMVWTSVGNVTGRMLTSKLISAINKNAEIKLQSGDYRDALMYMLELYRKVLQGEQVDVQSPNQHWYWPMPLWLIIVGAVIITLMVIGVILVAVRLCCWKKSARYQLTRQRP